MNRNYTARNFFLFFSFLLWSSFFILQSQYLLVPNSNGSTDFFTIYVNAILTTVVARPYYLLPFIVLGIVMYLFLFKDFAPVKRVRSIKRYRIRSFISVICMFSFAALMVGAGSFSARYNLLSANSWTVVNAAITDAVENTDTTAIISFIESQQTCDFISYSANGELAQDLFVADQSESSFYTNVYLKSIAPEQFKAKQSIALNSASIVIINDRLYIQKIDKDTWIEIIPKLGSKLATCAMSTKKLKTQPKYAVLTEQEYIAKETKQLEKYIADVQKQIEQLQKSITITETWLNSIVAYADRYGYSAQSLADKKTAERYLADYNNSLKTAQNYIAQATSREFTVQDELGNFLPPSTITLLYSPDFDKTPNVYVETLIHEHLHYESNTYNKGLPNFFEEGLTQIFTLHTLRSSKLPVTWTSYPIPVFIIQQMTDKIPLTTWEKIYYTKDVQLLETTINNAYGKGFYNDHLGMLESTTFDYTLKALQVANGFSEKIGGRYLPDEEFLHYTGLK